MPILSLFKMNNFFTVHITMYTLSPVYTHIPAIYIYLHVLSFIYSYTLLYTPLENNMHQVQAPNTYTHRHSLGTLLYECT